jgi:hypothetical protein
VSVAIQGDEEFEARVNRLAIEGYHLVKVDLPSSGNGCRWVALMSL